MKLSDMTWPEIKEAAAEKVALLPLAAIEQHGLHLSVSTDAALVTCVAEEVEARQVEDLVLCPTLPFGSSHHHLGFAGTLSISQEVYVKVVVDLARSLVLGGFTRIVLLNGHGGNITPVRQALSVLSHELDDDARPNLALVTYWEIAGEAFAGKAPMESPALSHACEYETSMMLHLFGDRIPMGRVRRSKRPAENAYLPWEDEGPYRGVSMVKRTHFISDIGNSGEPQKATAAKGQHLIRCAVDALESFLKEYRSWPLMEDLRP